MARAEEIGGVELRALTRLYETGESTRVRDLVDLALLVEDGVPADAALVRRVHHVFAIRRTHSVPDDLSPPPVAWAGRYALLAAEIGLAIASADEAHKIVCRHWQQARVAQER
ncbi:hypothetical protein O7606_14985 [Micromonospora sp. WMMD882]|uniref:hypothetical protein n=1 Tax=Micromonospora sp. WMMD882 TaxID=3015151 RepID=UPI00248CE5EF|nr:hypothetical protein [Micromonospora sp. WMMD882]WBB77587.1 hypothetical protein O7606_14985 [Micromonospora sp. WMMD882]